MSLHDILQQYAIESGEIEEPVVDELGLTEQDSHDLVDAKVDEITRAGALVESLESLAVRYCMGDINEASMENYQFTIGHLLSVSGLNIPVHVIAPSFESAEKAGETKKSMAEKAKAVIAAIIKWIREKFQALMGLFKRRADSAKVKTDKAKEETKVVLALKHKPNKGYAAGHHQDEKASGKHGSTNSQNNQSGHLARNEGGIVGEGDVKRNRHGGIGEDKEPEAKPEPATHSFQLPAWLVKDGKINTAHIDAVIALSKTGEFANVLKGLEPNGGKVYSEGEDVASKAAALHRWVDADYVTKVWHKQMNAIQQPAAGRGTVEGVPLEELKELVKKLLSAVEDAYDNVRESTRLAQNFAAMVERGVKGAKDEAEAKAWRALGVAGVRYEGEIEMINNNYHSVLHHCHSWLAKAAKKIGE